MGSKAPAFSTDAHSSSFIRTVGHGFALLCQAQAYPVPIFRQVCSIFIFTEPTNNIAPRKQMNEQFEGWKLVLLSANATAYMTCPVNAFPAPRFG